MRKLTTFSGVLLSVCAFLLTPAVFAADETLPDAGQKSDAANPRAVQSTPSPSGATDRAATQQRESAASPAKEPSILKASELIGYTVQNPEGQELGKIEELVINPKDGRIAYAALSFGGLLGVGDKLFAVPWKAMQPLPEQQSFKLNVTKEQLDNTPGFDEDNWPTVTTTE